MASSLPSSDPIRIGFVLTELIGGGAERSMLSIIDALDRRRFAPTLILFTDRRDHELPAGVPIVVLSSSGPWGPLRMLARVFDMARVVKRERIDLLVSFLIGPNVVSIAAGRRAGVPVVIGERSAPRTVLSDANPHLRQRGMWTWLVRTMYPRASHIITNTNGAKAELESFVGVPAALVSVIPNALDLARIRSLAAEPLDAKVAWPADPVLVHVGRFTHAKDHDTLLRAFARIRSRRTASLVLVGDGEEDAHVRATCTSLGLDRDVIFAGFTRNPYQYLARATISVLTSRFEGLPNALIEAMALGIPIVSTACQFGPVEMLGDNQYGVLTPVGDPEAFASAVDALLDDPARREEFTRRGLTRAADFDRSRIGPAYSDLFARIASRSSRATNT